MSIMDFACSTLLPLHSDTDEITVGFAVTVDRGMTLQQTCLYALRENNSAVFAGWGVRWALPRTLQHASRA